MVSFYRETGDRAQQVGFFAVVRQMLDRLGDQEARLLPRTLGTEHGDEGRLAGIGILAGALAGRFFIAAMVDQIVGDLEGEADIAGVAAVWGPRIVAEVHHNARGVDR